MRRRYVLTTLATWIGLLIFQRRTEAQRSLSVRIDRWLALRQLSGSVLYHQGTTSRNASVGDRLQAVGHGLSTGSGASATLEVDTGVGFVDVSENARLEVQELAIASDNGRITRLRVDRGQVRLRVRPFTHQGSELEIYTPAGVSGVRGTEFGVNVHSDGKMGVATLSGSVYTLAQGNQIIVPGGFQNLTIPGEPPSEPIPLRDNTELTYRIIRSIEGGQRRARFVGQVDAVNSVMVNGEPQVTDRDGRFTIPLPLRYVVQIEVIVITPLGRQQVHELRINL